MEDLTLKPTEASKTTLHSSLILWGFYMICCNNILTHPKYGREKLRSVTESISIFKVRNVKRILGSGCEAGRHVIYPAKNGFEIYGLDTSEHARGNKDG